MYRFEKLKVWQDSVELVRAVYDFTKQLPADEKFALTDQLKRSSSSVTLNIAEGSGSGSDRDFRNFLRIALKSQHETVASLKLAERLFGLDAFKALEKCDLVGKELVGLVKSLQL